MDSTNILEVQKGIKELVDRLDAKSADSVKIRDIREDISQLFELLLKYTQHVRTDYSEENEELRDRVQTLQEVERLLPGSIHLRNLLFRIYLNLHRAYYAKVHVFLAEDVDRFYREWTLNRDIINFFGKKPYMKQAVGVFDSIDEFLDRIQNDFNSKQIRNLDGFLLFTNFFYDTGLIELTDKVSKEPNIDEKIRDYIFRKYQECEEKFYALTKKDDLPLRLERKLESIEEIKQRYITALKNFEFLQKFKAEISEYLFIATRFPTIELIENEKLPEWLREFEELMKVIKRRNSEVINVLAKDEGVITSITYLQRLNTIMEKEEPQGVEGLVECAKYDLRDYNILRYIRGGGLKSVFEGVHKLDRKQKRVAIKIYVPTPKGEDILAMRKQELSDTVENEYLVRGDRVTNPNINAIQQAFFDYNADVFVTSEPLCKGSLDQVNYDIKNHEALPIRKTVCYTGQIVNGLYGLKEIGKIHADLKLPNILVAFDGTLRLTDFGQSPSLLRLSRLAGLQNVGYPTTMAPELLCTDNEPSEKSDVWSVGVLMYQMLTGKEPFSMDFNGTSTEWTSMNMTTRIMNHDQRVKDKIMSLGQWDIDRMIDGIPYKGTGEKITRRILKRCLTIKIEDRYDLENLREEISNLEKRICRYKR